MLINFVTQTQAGNYLISIRHTFCILLIDGDTGEIIWQMGGKRNDFEELPALNESESIQPVLSMSWQHHARFVPGTNETQMTLFDNHGKVTNHGECKALCSRGLHIAVDDSVSPPTVQFIREFRHPAQLQAQSQGSMQPLSPSADGLGNVFIGWGRCPSFTEHNALGETVMDVQFSPWHSDQIPDALDNYRAYKMDWSANPWWDPAIAPRKNEHGELVVYVSWNGATEVAFWVVRGTHNAVQGHKDDVLAVSSRTGFETKLTIGETSWRYLRAEAVDKNGEVLRTTEFVDMAAITLSVAYDRFEANSTFPLSEEEAAHRAGSLSTASILIITGMATLVSLTVSAVAIWMWRKRKSYTQLNEDFDLGSDELSEADFDLGLEELVEEDKQFDGDNSDDDDDAESNLISESRFRDGGQPLLPK